jgi:hypothetical protein
MISLYAITTYYDTIIRYYFSYYFSYYDTWDYFFCYYYTVVFFIIFPIISYYDSLRVSAPEKWECADSNS